MKSIEHDYIRILKYQPFNQLKLAQLGRHETVNAISGYYSPRVAGSISVRGNFFAEYILH